MAEADNEWLPEELEFKAAVYEWLETMNDTLRDFAMSKARELHLDPLMAVQIVGKAVMNVGTSLISNSLLDSSLNERLMKTVMAELDQWQFEKEEAHEQQSSSEPSGPSESEAV